MKRNFTNENFEGFLQQNADSLRMRPSDKVWSGITRHLNRRRRILGFTLGFSLLILTGIGYYFVGPTAGPASLNTSHSNKPGSNGANIAGHEEKTVSFQSSISQKASLILHNI